MSVKKYSLWLFIFSGIIAQPDNRFDIFDWVIYRQPGAVHSISEGFNYTYFGTENGGVWRYHLYRNTFEEPITKAQGLTSNQIESVYLDKGTGILWVATDKTIEYSYSRSGEWTSHSLAEYGLPGGSSIIKIGSSQSYLWLFTGSLFLKLDRVSGIMISSMTSPDEPSIMWNSDRYYYDFRLPEIYKNYIFSDGWLLHDNQLVDPNGRFYNITTAAEGSMNRIWICSEDGTIFLGDKQMETFYPMTIGPANTDVTAMTQGYPIHYAGRTNSMTKGITTFYSDEIEFDFVDFETTVNMNPQSIYSILEMEDEIWYGSDFGILVYDKEDDYWRQLDKTRGVPGVPVLAMAEDSGSVWVGSPRGISQIRKQSKRKLPKDLEGILDNQHVYDIEIVGETVWFAGDYFLLIYNSRDNLLTGFRKYGDTKEIGNWMNILKDFRKIKVANDHVVISTMNHILDYDIKKKKWSFLLQPTVFPISKTILTIEVTKDWCFIGTDKGLMRYDRQYLFMEEYPFPFIGSVREIVVHGDILWLGTNEGLIKFHWSYDL